MADNMTAINKRYHPLYTDNVANWAFYMQSYKGGQEYIKVNLRTHRLEDPVDFANRLQRAYYLNFCAPIANIPSEFIFKKEATRPADRLLEQFRENTDQRGANIHEFMRRVCTLSSIYGHVHVLVDRTRPTVEGIEAIKSGRITKATNFGEYAPPYATIVHPQNLLDWSINTDTKQLNWVIIREEVYNDEDFLQERVIETTYRVWTPTHWYLFNDDNEQIAADAHDLGFIPLLTCYHKDIDLDMIGEGMLKDVAETNRAIFNWCSNIDEMINRQTFSQLICPDSGELITEEIDEGGRSNALRRIGLSTIFTFPSDARNPPEFISPDTSQMKTVWEMVQNHVREMFRMSGLVSAKTSLIELRQRTGVAQQYEFLDMAVFLAGKAKKLEAVENRINEFAYLWYGEQKIKPERTHYPDRFDISSSAEMVDLFTKVTLSAISGTLNKELAKRVVHQVLPHAEDEIIEEIYMEIEENEILEDPTVLMMTNKNQTSPSQDGGQPTAPGEPDASTPKTPGEEKIVPPKKKKEIVPNSTKPTRRAKIRATQQDED